ncbi:MAG: META and DUF4377 domain-containing protein [Xanthomonadales bacterium]|nr:META and DUF4377 domain-containing protein [Xanthomonadales bacterium]
MKYCLFLLPLILAACTSQSPTPTANTPAPSTAATAASPATSTTAATMDHAQLGRYHWQLDSATDQTGQRIDALFANAAKPLQLDFNDGRLSISNTCNHINGSYRLVDGHLHSGPLAQTMMACADASLMALDKAVSQFLQGNPAFAMRGQSASPRLSLTGNDGSTLIFVGTPTAATRYGSQGDTVFMEVAAHTVPCRATQTIDQPCLSVRNRHYDGKGIKLGTPGAWHPLQQDIEGYTHAPGVRNVLRLKRYHLADAPAGATSVAYVLDMTVESEIVKP